MIFFDRSPLAMAVATPAMLRTWPVRLPAIDADLARHVRHLIGEGRKRVRHVVDGFAECGHFPLGLHTETLAEIAVGHGGHHLDDAAHLIGEV